MPILPLPSQRPPSSDSHERVPVPAQTPPGLAGMMLLIGALRTTTAGLGQQRADEERWEQQTGEERSEQRAGEERSEQRAGEERSEQRAGESGR